MNGTITPTALNYTNKYGALYTMYQNPLGEEATSSNTYKNQSAIGSGFVTLQPLPGLKIKGTLSGQQYTINNTGYTGFDNWQYGTDAHQPL